MRHHKVLTANTGVDVHFAHPQALWARETNEHTNGLLRQSLSKGNALLLFSREQLDDIAWRLDIQPRESLGWKRPAEHFFTEGASEAMNQGFARISQHGLWSAFDFCGVVCAGLSMRL
jgi:IS30 family transposase